MKFFPAWLHKHGTVGKDDGWDAPHSIIYVDYKFSGFFVAFESDPKVIDFICFKKSLCPKTVWAIFSGIHHNL